MNISVVIPLFNEDESLPEAAGCDAAGVPDCVAAKASGATASAAVSTSREARIFTSSS